MGECAVCESNPYHGHAEDCPWYEPEPDVGGSRRGIMQPDDEPDDAGREEAAMGWEPGDPCGVCGSRDTGWTPEAGGFCRSCGACDSDE